MLPDEINPYGFKFFKKHMLPLPDVYKLFRKLRLLNMKETTKAISRTGEGLIVLTHKPKESVIYTPGNKLTYFTKEKKLALKKIIPRFVKAKILDLIVLRFKRFCCCLSRQSEDTCGMYLMSCSDKEKIRLEDILVNPSGIPGEITATIPTVDDNIFRFKDLERFGKSVARDDIEESDDDLGLNPIDSDHEDTGEIEKGLFSIELKNSGHVSDDGERSKENKVPGDSNYCIEVPLEENQEEEDLEQELCSPPYKEVKEGEEGLFDYIASKILNVINDDTVKKSKPWKVIEGEDSADWSSSSAEGESGEAPGSGMEWRERRKPVGARGGDGRLERKKVSRDKYKGTIKFGAIKNGKLEYIQKRIRSLSVTDFDRLEMFIARVVKSMQTCDVNYIEVCSEVDFFIVKNSTIRLYIRDMVHRKEGSLLTKFNKMFESLDIKM